MADRFDFDVNGNRRLAIIRSSPAPRGETWGCALAEADLGQGS